MRTVCGALALALTLAAGCGARKPDRPAHSARRPALTFTDPVDIAAGPDGRLWVADYRDSALVLVRATGDRLAQAGRIPARGGPNRLAVDRRGLIWAALYDTGELAAWDPGSRGVRPTIRIRVPGLEKPTGLGFDDRGRLWVTSQAGGALLGFRPAVLSRSGEVRPTRRVALPGGAAAVAEDVAFDSGGRAYVAQYEAGRIVVLRRSGKVARIVRAPDDGPVDVRRGPDGAIWVTNATSGDFVRLTAGGGRKQRVRAEELNVPHSISFVGDRAYVTDMSTWILGYPLAALQKGRAEPVLSAR